MTRPARVRRLTTAVLAGAMLLAASACGGQESRQQVPSAEEFCRTLTENAAVLRDAPAQLRSLAESSGASRSVSDLAAAAKSFIDLSNLYDDLAQAAPPEIKADVEKVRTTFGDLRAGADADTTQLAADAREALASLRNSGELQRLNDYASRQCGVELG